MRVQLTKSLVVLRDTYVTLIYTISEIDTQKGLYIIFGGQSYKVESCRCIIDIGQHQLRYMVLLGQLQKFFFGKGSEAETVICMAV